ncbi:MAG: DUF1232 domain-containing protein [Deltaproteobacteria bacterium]|nr:DUF1232 domain-containing protein [Deltaproteobacteria bacterium]
MNELDRQCLEAFPGWLTNLGEDARAVSKLVADEALPESMRRYVTGALNYLFKSLDLISDGIEDIGFLDDAFVLRVAADLALAEAPEGSDKPAELVRFANDVGLLRSLLDTLHPRLEAYVKRLRTGTARGRSVDDILSDESLRGDFLNEVDGWATSYEAPAFARDEKNLVKLKSFLSTQLP